MNKLHITWTDDRKKSVAVLLREGLSAGQIGKRLEISRNAIIGIIHRDPLLSEIGLAGTVGGARKPKTVSKAYQKGRLRTSARPAALLKEKIVKLVAPQSTVELDPVAEADSLSVPLNLPLIDLARNQCRFATNNAAKGEQHLFCGLEANQGSSFCDHHHRIVFVPAPRLKGL